MTPFCFRCSQPLMIVRRGGRVRTIDNSGEEHYKVCAGRARKPEQRDLLDGVPHVQGQTVVGANYQKVTCDSCPALPWEPCPCFPRAA